VELAMSRSLSLIWLSVTTLSSGAGVALGLVLEHALK